ncbi:Aldolase [Penicillium atrosanguineum]|nr:Aldolase [Penicillium atrosanguineum]
MSHSKHDVAVKYQKQLPISNLKNRQWPSERLAKAPTWLSTDLRDGNQALVNPMTLDQKWQFFQLLVGMGFKQIEVSFPCASDTEFNFTRRLVETPGAIPPDVTIEVISPCRKEALARTIESIKGAPNAIIFTFMATSDNYQETIFEASEETLLERARTCTEYVRSITKDDPIASSQTNWSFGFGMEDFGNSRPEVALRLGETVRNAWNPSRENPVILGLATSVESHMPNVYADQVEYFSTNISNRETVCISLHTHNDRGCAVASAELGCLAGADRVEGCLFGNGERAGNLDLVTMALNCLTQGVDPGLDFSHLPYIRQVYEEITRLPIHPRTPYSGDLYFRAWSGSHQDSIRKGMIKYNNARTDNTKQPTWRVPYLPLDPADVGQSFNSVIGINSQSGKAGVSWVLLQELGLDLPCEVAMEFSKVTKVHSERLGRGLVDTEVCDLFLRTFSVREISEDVWLSCYGGPRVKLDINEYADLGSVEKMIARLSNLLARSFELAEIVSQNLDSVTAKSAVFIKCNLKGVGHVWGVGVGVGGMAIARSVISALMVSKSNTGTACSCLITNADIDLNFIE